MGAWWRYGRPAQAGTPPAASPAGGGSYAPGGGTVAQRPDQGSNPPPSVVSPSTAAGTLRARYVIISGATGGWFIYSGTPGAGNPPIAYGVSPSTVQDPFGNSLAVSDSVTSIGSGDAYASLNDGQLVLNSGAGSYSPAFIAASTLAAGIVGINTGLASSIDTATTLIINSEVNGGDAVLSGPLVATAPGSSTPETWHYVGAASQPAFATGWGNAGSNADLAFRLVAAPASVVQIIGVIAPSTGAADLLFTLPAGYRPADSQVITGNNRGTGALVAWLVRSTGTVAITAGSIVTGDTYDINGLISLDI
jgi:hypothetical protein